ncbi:MAG: hypothetical protein RIN56_16675 [Sporomusaceae bacterium]|nr:hypothetical protein [Sporomusaceae bacterium]
MSFFLEICNRAFIKELSCGLNTNVLLFSADGFTYFGNLQEIEDCRIALLTPAASSESNSVEILTPGGELVNEVVARVDLCSIVAKSIGITHDPIYHPGPMRLLMLLNRRRKETIL